MSFQKVSRYAQTRWAFLRNVDDHASTSFQLKIKEAIHIQKELPSLNQQLHHVNLKLSF